MLKMYLLKVISKENYKGYSVYYYSTKASIERAIGLQACTFTNTPMKLAQTILMIIYTQSSKLPVYFKWRAYIEELVEIWKYRIEYW